MELERIASKINMKRRNKHEKILFYLYMSKVQKRRNID
jgi:hypothetical protein